MRVISIRRLKQFWEASGHEKSRGPLREWHRVVDDKGLTWKHWADVKATYATASIVGDCVVFNIGGNKYRLIARIRYRSHRVYVLKVMTHEQYDKENWAKDCGCYGEHG